MFADRNNTRVEKFLENIRCYSLMWLNPRLSVKVLCGSSNNQMTHSNVGPPYISNTTYSYTSE